MTSISFGMDNGNKSTFERRNPRGLQPDSDEDDSDVSKGSDDDEAAGFLDHTAIDVNFEDEVGFGMIQNLRGRTTGRRIKREICIFTFYQLCVGISLGIIAWRETRTKFIMDFFKSQDSSAQGWTKAISTMCLIWASVNILILKYWSSVVTNRVLFSTILKLMVLIFFIKFILILIAFVTVINIFSFYRYGAGATADVNHMFPFFISSGLLLFAYLLCTCFQGMNLSYLNEEVELGGNIREPNPVGAIDLTGTSFQQCCTTILSFPVALIYQAAELVYAIYLMGSRGWYFFWRRYEEHRQASSAAKAAAAALRNKKGRSFYRRLKKTLKRWLSMVPGFRPAYEVDPFVQPLPQDLQNIRTGDREQAERLEQERAAEQAERRAAFEKAILAKDEADEEARKKLEAEAAEAAKKLKLLEEEEARIAANQLQTTLNSEKFKEKWGELPQAGSFQCKLKLMPEVKAFAAHLTKQGFHVVFAAGPGSNGEIEVGLCNIRTSNDEKWFLARLLAAKGAFSAIMKAETPDIVPKYVKKFALAKILKIDTSKK